MKTTLKRLTNYESLSKNEAKEIITNIAEGKYNNSQIASFLTVFMMRNISLEELEGFREALIELCISVDLSEFNTIDLCGTGGDGKDTFNISTLCSNKKNIRCMPWTTGNWRGFWCNFDKYGKSLSWHFYVCNYIGK